jgi:hypothetical protein
MIARETVTYSVYRLAQLTCHAIKTTSSVPYFAAATSNRTSPRDLRSFGRICPSSLAPEQKAGERAFHVFMTVWHSLPNVVLLLSFTLVSSETSKRSISIFLQQNGSRTSVSFWLL